MTIAYRRTRSELVVDEEELGETEREGVRMEFLRQPGRGHRRRQRQGRARVKFIRNSLGEPDATGRRAPVPIEGSEFVIKADTVIPAVSQAADNTFLPVESSFEINRGRVQRRPGHVRDERPRRLRLRRLRDRPNDAHRGGRSRQEVRLRRRSLPVRPARGRRQGQRPHRQLVAPRDARVLRRPAARARAHDRGRARLPSADPHVNFTTPVERGYSAEQAVTESTRCLMCNYNIWFDPFRCVLCGACADVCPEGVIHMIDVNQMKSEGALPELVDAYGWSDGAAMVLDEERCIRCALCVKRCPYDAITMERFELQEISSDGRLYKESYRDTQLGTRSASVTEADAGGYVR